MYDLAIIGGGPAGLTAGIYGARRALKTVIFEQAMCGGQTLLTGEIENYPGFEKITGADIAQKMQTHAEKFNVEINYAIVDKIDLQGDVKKIIIGEKEVEAKSIIISTGGSYRKLGVTGEEEFSGRGVSYCATCDGPFFKDKTVVVVGGGNTAAEEALYLSEIAGKTILIHRRDSFRCEEVQVQQMKEKKVEFILESQITEFIGNDVLEKIIVETPNGKIEVKTDGCFIAVGVNPESTIAEKAGVKIDDDGFIVVDKDMKTNKEGVFAAGDVTGGIMQVATAVGEGTIAAMKAYEYVKNPYWKK